MNETKLFYDEQTGLYFNSSFKKLGEAITLLNLHRMVNSHEPTSLKVWGDIIGISIPDCLMDGDVGFDSYAETQSLIILNFVEPDEKDRKEFMKVRLKLFSY